MQCLVLQSSDGHKEHAVDCTDLEPSGPSSAWSGAGAAFPGSEFLAARSAPGVQARRAKSQWPLPDRKVGAVGRYQIFF